MESWLLVVMTVGLEVWPGEAGGVLQGGKGEVPQGGLRTPEGREEVGNKRQVSPASYFCPGTMAPCSYFTVSPL